MWGANVTIIDSTFINNAANGTGGAAYLGNIATLTNCCFNNSKSINHKSNGIHTTNNLTINGGKGIVDILSGTNFIISGTSIVVLNNATYYYPPNTNINFTKKNIKQDLIE